MKIKGRAKENGPVCKMKQLQIGSRDRKKIGGLQADSKLKSKGQKEPESKGRNASLMVNTKATPTTQDSSSYTTEMKKSRTDELMALVGLGNLKNSNKNPMKLLNNIKPEPTNQPKIVNGDSKHKRISSEISNISQFENVDEESMKIEANKGKY